MQTYTKNDSQEDIEVGDLISITPDGTVTRSYQYYNKKPDTTIIGIATKVNKKQVEVEDSGIVDVNIIGSIGVGERVTASKIPGKGATLKYTQEQKIWNIRSIGKVIGLYNDRYKVKVLLNIE